MGNKFFENLTNFRYLVTSLTNQIAFMRKLRADEIQGMPLVSRVPLNAGNFVTS
jgi:hypothetical protein